MKSNNAAQDEQHNATLRH